jgi:hypothetical protein
MEERMKKIGISFLLSIFVFCFSLSAFADQEIEIKMVVDNPKASVNGKEIILDVPPTVIKSRTLVPIRFISEALGATVDWDAATRTITIRIPDAINLKQKLAEVREELAQLKESILEKAKEMQEKLEASEKEVSQLKAEIVELKNTHASEKKELEDKIASLEEMVEDLEEKLAAGGGAGLMEESEAPIISLTNLTEGQSISEVVTIQGSIKDESPVVFVRVKLGSLLLHEGNSITGTINPLKLVSGEYTLKVEAIDAFGNKGEFEQQVKISNAPKDEPVKLTSKILDMGGMGGMGAMLYASTVNKASSLIEFLNLEVFDAKGERFEIMPGVGFIEVMKMQMEMEHLMLHHDDKISLPVAMDMENTGKPAKDFFKDWKIKVTLFDPIMEKEFVLETTFKG